MTDSFKNKDFVDNRIVESTPGMWQHYFDEGRPFSRVSQYFNDFHSWVADAWTVTEVGTSTQEIEDLRNGVLRLTSGGTEDNGNQLQLGGSGDSETIGESFAPESSKNLWFECRIKSNDVTQHDIFVGLHVQDTTAVASRGSDYIGFRTDDGDALLDIECASGSASSSETGVATLVDDTWITLGFKVTGTSKIEYYVNNVLSATLTTNIPTALMKLTIGHLTGEGAANELDIDYIICAQDR